MCIGKMVVEVLNGAPDRIMSEEGLGQIERG